MPKSGTAPRPKETSWSDLVKSAWNGYMQNKNILVPLAIPTLFSLLLTVFQLEEFALSIGAAGAFAAFILIIAIFIPLSIYASGAAISIVKDSIRGRARLADAWRTAGRKFWSLLGASLLAGLIFAAVYFVGLLMPIVLMVVSASAGNSLLLIASLAWMAIGFIALVIVSIFLGFTSYAVIISDTKAVEGLRTSWSLVKKNFWSVIILYILTFLIMLPIFIASFASGFVAVRYPGYQFPITLLSVLVTWLITPLLLMLSGYFYMQRKK